MASFGPSILESAELKVKGISCDSPKSTVIDLVHSLMMSHHLQREPGEEDPPCLVFLIPDGDSGEWGVKLTD